MNPHEKYMSRCLELAEKGLGKVSPNPLVGAVIVYQDKIIGEGFHAVYGGAHAEVNAVNSVIDKSLLKEATLYVNLEPCCHHGKTPPCTSLILEHQIKKVVVGSRDPNELVSGKGIQLLKENGVEIIEGVLKEKCDFLNRRFFTFHQKKRPYIILKWAESADGFMDIDRSNGEVGQYQLSGKESKRFVHQLRANEDAILVGVNAVMNDNPSLTVREVSGKNPIRIVIDKDLKTPKESKLLRDGNKTIFFTTKELNNLPTSVSIIQIPFINPIAEMLNHLYEMGISSLIVEGGQKTLQSFIDCNAYDEVITIVSKDKYLVSGKLSPKIQNLRIQELVNIDLKNINSYIIEKEEDMIYILFNCHNMS